MSTTQLRKFILYAPDKTEEGTHDRRLAVREKHLANAKELTGTGLINVAGALLTPESIESETSDVKMVGSVIIYEAETLAEAKKMAESDIYYTSGVWDPEKLVVLPYRVAVKSERILM